MTDTLNDAAVKQWLERHPEFLSEHPDLLERLKIPHGVEGTSLIEHQVSVLQDKVSELKRKLQHYHDTAAQNEQLLSRIHAIQLDMMQAESLTDLLVGLRRRLEAEFDCQQVIVALFDGEGLPAEAGVVSLAGDQARELFAELATAAEPVCGRLRRERLALLFGEAAADIQSAAVATLDRQVMLGLLALGSRDEHKFHPGMGTLFLSLLAQTLGHCLAQHLPEQQQQQA